MGSLASTSDLSARNISVPAGVDANAILDAASSAVRDAAGCPISQATSTVTLVVDDACEIGLPAGPVSSVASVTLNGSPIVGWTKVGDTIYLPPRWTDTLPVEVTVVYTHGLPIVPADIVDLVCAMAAMAFKDAASGDYGTGSLVTRVQLGDFGESYARPAGQDSPSRLAVPKSLRDALRARFGAGAATIRVIR